MLYNFITINLSRNLSPSSRGTKTLGTRLASVPYSRPDINEVDHYTLLWEGQYMEEYMMGDYISYWHEVYTYSFDSEWYHL